MSASEHITREIMQNVPPWLAAMFYLASLLVCAWTALSFVRRFRQHRRGRQNPCRGTTHWVEVAGSLLGYLTFHRQLLRDRFAGIAHLLLFYGPATIVVVL